MVGKEYLRFFEFEKLSLVESLRQFLLCFSLTGESQERERIMVHFSDRYFECNPQVFASVGELKMEARERERERER
jgi:PH/SEC7 domain-containing protein